MSADHRAEAITSLRYWAAADETDRAISYATEATAQALLALEAQAARIADALELGAVINATVTGTAIPSPHSRVAAEAWIRARVVEITAPATTTEENSR